MMHIETSETIYFVLLVSLVVYFVMFVFRWFGQR